MKFRSFIVVLAFVALIAIIYSPSTIGVVPSGSLGTTSPTDASENGASLFLAFLQKSGYHVVLVNNTQGEQNLLSSGRAVLLLLGADTPLSQTEIQAIGTRYGSGHLSLLIAEGNRTNGAFLTNLYGASVSGAPIYDSTSTFKDQRVFTVTLNLGTTSSAGIIDIASPITLGPGSVLRSVAETSSASFDTLNRRLGPRTVIAAGENGAGSRTVLITDSAPFTNYLFAYNQSANEQTFVGNMVDWVTRSNRSVTILYDNYHYKSATPKFSIGLPVGPLVAYVLEQSLSSLNNYYGTLPGQLQGFLQHFGISVPDALARLAIALLLLFTLYGAVTRWFASEKKGRDDQPLPNTEKSIVAESKSRIDFLATSRNKSFYVATLARLYEVFDDIVLKQLGTGVSSVGEEQLKVRLGEQAGEEAFKLFKDLSKIYEYANGRRRLLLPPVLRWKSRVSLLTTRAEDVLNHLGMTMTGSEEAKEDVEYVLRSR